MMSRDYFDGRPTFYDRQGQPITHDEYAQAKYGTDEYRRIGLDTYPDLVDNIDPDHPLDPGRAIATVSTVWLGIDHGFGGYMTRPGEVYRPVIFETMIFSADDHYDTQCVRYATEAEATEGHWRTMQDLRSGQVPWFMRDETADADEE
jgi:hypothetical protein